jgi:hypothetical protein
MIGLIPKQFLYVANATGPVPKAGEMEDHYDRSKSAYRDD